MRNFRANYPPEVIRLKFRTAASADMRRVSAKTRARWGDAQAAAYSANLRDDITSLCAFPLRLPESEGRHPGLRRMNSGRHAVFFLASSDLIEVVRVLHSAMDFDEWLG
jgi:toxin ParE1/3/4